MNKKKIGIMGGTFDPIHKGHMMLAEYAYKCFGLDEVWFMPNGKPPHKDWDSIETTAKERLEMVRLAIKDFSEYRLEPYEVLEGHTCCTYSTMEHFKEVYPDYDFYFIIGADSLQMLDTWVHPERIFPTCTLVATCRDDMNTPKAMEDRIRELKEKYQEVDIRFMKTPMLPLSSSDLRKKLKDQMPVEDDIPKVVYEYIMEHGLYGRKTKQHTQGTI